MVIAHREAKGPARLEKGVHVSFDLRRDGREYGLILLPECAHHRGGSGGDGSHEQVRRWPLDQRRPPVDPDLAEARVLDQSLKLVAVAEREPRQRTARGSEPTPEGTLDRRIRWAVLHGAPARDPEASARAEDPSHLAKGLEAIREELEALLTEDEIKDARSERQLQSPRLEPCHVRVGHHCAPDGQHGRVNIEADCTSPGGHALGHQTRDRAGSAGHVQGPIAAAWRLEVQEIPGSHQAEALNGMALVDFGGGSAQIAQRSLSVTVHVHLGTVWNRDRVPIPASQNQTTVVGRSGLSDFGPRGSLERELSAGALEEFARAYPMLMLEQNRLLPGARAR
jgi:hypothetical protein